MCGNDSRTRRIAEFQARLRAEIELTSFDTTGDTVEWWP